MPIIGVEVQVRYDKIFGVCRGTNENEKVLSTTDVGTVGEDWIGRRVAIVRSGYALYFHVLPVRCATCFDFATAVAA